VPVSCSWGQAHPDLPDRLPYQGCAMAASSQPIRRVPATMYKTVLLPRRFHHLLLRSLSLTALPPSAVQSGEIGRSGSSLRDVDSLETRNQNSTSLRCQNDHRSTNGLENVDSNCTERRHKRVKCSATLSSKSPQSGTKHIIRSSRGSRCIDGIQGSDTGLCPTLSPPNK
jgi:hypothetical protein